MSQPTYFTNYFESNTEYVPFYVKTTGMNCFQKGHSEKVDRLFPLEIDIYWGIDGTGKIQTSSMEATIGKDQIFLCYPREEPRRTALSEKWEFRWLRLAGPLALVVVMSYGFPRFMPSYRPYPAELFERLDELCAEKSLFSIRRAAAVVLDILAHADGHSMQYSSYEQMVMRADEFIKNNLSDPELTVESLSAYFHISRPTLTKIFRKHGLPSPGRRILDFRLLRARELIYGTDLNVIQMSQLCGFSEPHTFTRFIKRAIGASPMQCRKNRMQQLKPIAETVPE